MTNFEKFNRKTSVVQFEFVRESNQFKIASAQIYKTQIVKSYPR